LTFFGYKIIGNDFFDRASYIKLSRQKNKDIESVVWTKGRMQNTVSVS